VYDRASGLEGELRDVAISGGRIAKVELPGVLRTCDAREVFDATGKLVMPGLVDLHAHGFAGMGEVGIDFDDFCIARGTTTVVDAGSAGSANFEGFRRYIIDTSATRVLCFLNVSMIGITTPAMIGSNQAKAHLSADECQRCIEANRDVIVGVKVLLSRWNSDGGKNEQRAFDAALEATAATGLPLMTHHSSSSIPLEDCPGKLRPGDIYTHCFHPFETTIMKCPSGGVEPVVVEAQKRGVLMDVGHGSGSFSWPVVERCIADGFVPDAISTDIWTLTSQGPCYDLPTVMSRFLHVGMPLADVIAASTLQPAQAMGWSDRIGTLTPGRMADITCLDLDDVDILLEDSNSQLRRLRRRLKPAAVWRDGVQHKTTLPEDLCVFPNPVEIQKHADSWLLAHYRDEEPPPSLDRDVPKSNLILNLERHGQKVDGGGGVSSSGASAATRNSPMVVNLPWLCVSAHQWPGGPPLQLTDTCCGPQAMVGCIKFDQAGAQEPRM
jgi:dihydroorotase